MKQLPLISSHLYCQPWAILPQNHAELGQLYRSYLSGTLPAAIEGSARVTSGIAYSVDKTSGIALVTVEGIIAKRAPDIMCGPRIADLAVLDSILTEINNDAQISTLLLYFNTPGGSVIGLTETAEAIRDLAETRRVVAYADVLCASAGYYLAAACDEIYTAPSAIIGSIGTYIAALDDSRAWEMEGLELKLFRVGTLKAIGHPGKAFTPEEEAHLQQFAESAGTEFKNWVTSRRPGVQDATMQGQTFHAKTAPTGLIDGTYNTIELLLSDLMAA
jgi:signal peptide peptidase SppA